MNCYSVLMISMFFVVRCGQGILYPEDQDTVEDCDAACENMERLGCEEGKGSPGPDEQYGTEDDVSCLEVCRNVMGGDDGIPIRPICVSKVDACENVGDCYK